MGEPILLIQGVGVTGGGWSPQVCDLSEQFQAITFDNRGIGKSTSKNKNISIENMVGDALSILNHLKIKSAHVVGHSMGGTIAQKLAIDHPDRVKSLSLLCTFSKGNQAVKMNTRIFWLGLRSLVGTRRMRRKAFLEILYSKKFLAEQSSLDALASQTGKIVGRDLAESPPVVMQQLRAMKGHDSSGDLPKLKGIRTIVVCGSEDPIARPEFGQDLARRIPGSKYLLLDNASHGLVLERPAEINKILLDFISQLGQE